MIENKEIERAGYYYRIAMNSFAEYIIQKMQYTRSTIWETLPLRFSTKHKAEYHLDKLINASVPLHFES